MLGVHALPLTVAPTEVHVPGGRGPEVRVLALCTANQCRSPMAEVLLARELEERGTRAVVMSAGGLPGGIPASAGSVKAMAKRGLDLRSHTSRQLTDDVLAGADLVLCMARRHAREAVVRHPQAWPRTFTLKELVRRGEAVGPRRQDQPLDDWLAELGVGRTRSGLLGDDPVDDVEDPIGGPDAAYESTAALLEDLVARAVAVAFPAAAVQVAGSEVAPA